MITVGVEIKALGSIGLVNTDIAISAKLSWTSETCYSYEEDKSVEIDIVGGTFGKLLDVQYHFSVIDALENTSGEREILL